MQQPPRAVEDHIGAAANVAAPKPPGGAPPLMPAGTPARYGESAVYDALTAGLSELGVDAKVTGVDCREFPCLFMGTNFGTREEADALRRTQQMSQYGDDTVVFGWADGKQADGSERWSFALAVYPHGDEERDGETMNRIGFRVDEARRAKAQ